jgi:hypothetical protein
MKMIECEDCIHGVRQIFGYPPCPSCSGKGYRWVTDDVIQDNINRLLHQRIELDRKIDKLRSIFYEERNEANP